MAEVKYNWLNDEQLLSLAKKIAKEEVKDEKGEPRFNIKGSRQDFIESCRKQNYTLVSKGIVYKYTGTAVYDKLTGVLGRTLPNTPKNQVEVDL